MVGKALPLLSGSAWKEMHTDKAEPLENPIAIISQVIVFFTLVGTEGVVGSILLAVTVPETLLFKESCVSSFVCFMIPKPGLYFGDWGRKVNDITSELGEAP
ncbi:hypothetical protein Tco_0704633 [Tanacetum coccineum]|uniref:Uncharacterized protein n=1 Tax=Tanacetum coccineum TaxID=301880 RepID=A0ABQ4Y325_9ASTR